MVCVPEVALAEMVIVEVPTATRRVVEKVTVTAPPLVTDDGEKLTVWALPDVVAVVSVAVVDEPGVTVPVDWLRLIEKAFGTTAVTVKV